MKPLDPRLVKRSAAARSFLVAGGALALVQAVATAAFAWCLASAISTSIAAAGLPQAVVGWAVGAVVAVAVRAGAAWCWEQLGAAGAARVKRGLRGQLLAASDALPGAARPSAARLGTLLGPGLDALDAYFARYLPQLLLTAVATPVLVGAAWLADPLSGLILCIVLPLLPVFLVLIGYATQAVQRRQWVGLQRLSGAFLEVVGGLSTLILYGRAERQVQRIRATTEDYRAATTTVLRVTFLSGFALELGASLSIALVAVAIGLRLVTGEVSLGAGLFVLVLAPDVFLPLRNVGAAFHASAAGIEASRDAFDLLDDAADAARSEARHAVSTATSPGHPASAALVLRGFAALRAGAVVAGPLDVELAPGQILALAGPSGSGKSSFIAALLGFAEHDGEVRVGSTGVLGATEETGTAPSLAERRARIAWSPQQPVLFAGTVAGNVRLGSESAPVTQLERALASAGVDLEPEHPVGPGGAGLSGGQAQRVGAARAIHRALAEGCPLLVLDEPSSALDPAHERRLLAGIRGLAATGVAVVIATHRPALVEAADVVVDLAAVRHG